MCTGLSAHVLAGEPGVPAEPSGGGWGEAAAHVGARFTPGAVSAVEPEASTVVPVLLYEVRRGGHAPEKQTHHGKVSDCPADRALLASAVSGCASQRAHHAYACRCRTGVRQVLTEESAIQANRAVC